MRRRRSLTAAGLILLALASFFLLPVVPIGSSGTVVAYPDNGCDYSGCAKAHPVQVAYSWSALASPAYHFLSCGGYYSSGQTARANMSYQGRLELANVSGSLGWYCGTIHGAH